MLKTRLWTAGVLLAFLLPALFAAEQRIWVATGVVIVLAAAWEWGRLLQAKPVSQWGFVGTLAALCGVCVLWAPTSLGLSGQGVDVGGLTLASGLNQVVYGLALLFWCVLVPLWLRYKWSLSDHLFAWGVGIVVIFPAWLALIQLRAFGPWLLLAVMAVAWVADVAAYFCGRLWGRHKLAPLISPGKTWEGAAGALLAVLIYGLGLRWVSGFSLAWPVFLGGLVALTALSIAGDLFESLLKRQAGLKDSSQLLPGHGGVLDRIDSLTAVLPVAAVLWLTLVA